MAADGFDVVEMVMEIEEGLGVVIPDAEAERMRTLGDVHRYVVGVLRPYESAACLTSAVFYRVRRALCDLCGADRRDLRPDTRLDELMPPPDRRECWRRLGEAVALPMFPELRRPAWVTRSIATLTVVFLIIRVAGWCWGWSATALMAMTVLSLIAGKVAWWATRPLADRIPPYCASVGDLVRALRRTNFGPRADCVRRCDPADVWEALRRIVAPQLGVSPDSLTEDSLFLDPRRA